MPAPGQQAPLRLLVTACRASMRSMTLYADNNLSPGTLLTRAPEEGMDLGVYTRRRVSGVSSYLAMLVGGVGAQIRSR